MGCKIRRRTEAKEIRLSGNLAMTKEQWEQRGGIYRGSIGTAARTGYYTVRGCERLGFPVSDEEFKTCNDFAMFVDCYVEFCINGKRPCLPVFYRNVQAVGGVRNDRK